MKTHISADLEPAEIEELVAYLREMDAGRTDRVFKLWIEDETLSQEQAQAWLHHMGMHHQIVLPNDPQGIHFSEGGGS